MEKINGTYILAAIFLLLACAEVILWWLFTH
jgi:hypothetical protein